MGKRVRDNEGRFTSLKRKVKLFISRFVKLSMFVGVVYVAILFGRYSNPEIYQIAPETQAVVKDTLTDKVRELKNEVLDDLKSCESGGYDNSDGIIIFDSNNEASIGQYQFQRKTMIYYHKMFYGEEISPKEAILIALDEQRSRDLAEKILFQDEGKAHNNWYNCSKKLGLKEKIELIKQLEE